MFVIADIETNRLDNPDRLWLIVCKEVETGKVHVFREPDREPEAFREFASRVGVWIGHNFLGFDYLHINRLCPGVCIDPNTVIDTLVVSRLTNFERERGHSLDAWGETLGLSKISFNDWSCLSEEMVRYCIRDVEVNYKVYLELLPFIQSPLWKESLRTEHSMVLVCNDMHNNGFYFDIDKAQTLCHSILRALDDVEADLQEAFPPKAKAIREITPKATKHGTIHRGDFKWVVDGDLTPYSVGAPFTLLTWEPFNSASPSQIVERLNEAGWKPFEKTKGHFLLEREVQTLQRQRKPVPKEALERLEKYRVSGWKVSEANLETLPETAPGAARKLVRALILKNRYRLLQDWISRVDPSDGRIHGSFNHIGAWTHRMSHADPNLANIPTEKPQDTEETKEINRTLRSLWCTPEDRLLVGVDADSIQLRILAHYMQDERFIDALVNGDKSKGTDVHSLNAKALGPVCQGRRDAKTFIYAWLLGAGIARVADILACLYDEAREARENFLRYYPGLETLKTVDIPRDAHNGYFTGLDGRFIPCNDEHYMLAGYLQNGEQVIMKRACLKWRAQLTKEKIPFWQVNFVHDEWQTETINDMEVAKYVAEVQAKSIELVGQELGLRCPLKGSILGGHDQIAIGNNWYDTH